MTAIRIEDLINVECEHLLGLNTRLPLVKFRAESDKTVIVGQLTVEQAREVALHLLEAAARSEYEHDHYIAAKAHGMPDSAIAAIFHLVRQGEITRHTRLDP